MEEGEPDRFTEMQGAVFALGFRGARRAKSSGEFLLEREGAAAHDLIMRAGGFAGIAQINRARAQAAPARGAIKALGAGRVAGGTWASKALMRLRSSTGSLG
jgi:hypothetical protein